MNLGEVVLRSVMWPRCLNKMDISQMIYAKYGRVVCMKDLNTQSLTKVSKFEFTRMFI